MTPEFELNIFRFLFNFNLLLDNLDVNKYQISINILVPNQTEKYLLKSRNLFDSIIVTLCKENSFLHLHYFINILNGSLERNLFY